MEEEAMSTAPRAARGRSVRMWRANDAFGAVSHEREEARRSRGGKVYEPTPVAVLDLRAEAVEGMVAKGAKYLQGIRFDPDNYGDAEGLSRTMLGIYLGPLPKRGKAKGEK